MNAIETILAQSPDLTSYVFCYRAQGLTDEQILERFKDGAPSVSPMHRAVSILGNEHVSQPLPSQYARRERKECFSNATHLSLENPDLTYVEGFAVRGWIGIPVHHAWCVTEDGLVVDVTWDRPEECSYFGIEFDESSLIDRLRETGVYGILDDEFSKILLKD